MQQFSGLSPLARGTRGVLQFYWHRMRFIPAGAGNTTPQPLRTSGGPVYPRWRGEHVAALSRSPRDFGLSPLARGTLVILNDDPDSERFIPAGAGNTNYLRSTSARRPVYPRWRGEHKLCRFQQRRKLGLSPLARGTQQVIRQVSVFPRFIPAGAGNTHKVTVGTVQHAVYPRWRGEHCDAPAASMDICGLSPLARGTPAQTPRRQC